MEYVALTGVVGGLVGVFAGLYQYTKGQRWKRVEFAAKEFEKFRSNPQVARALLMLDWNKRHYRLTEGESESDENFIQDSDLVSGLQYHSTERTFSQKEVKIRAAFDAMLDGLETINNYIDSGLVSKRDFKLYLSYWLNILANPHSGRKPAGFYASVHEYLTKYHFDGTVQLLGRFGYDVDALLGPSTKKPTPVMAEKE